MASHNECMHPRPHRRHTARSWPFWALPIVGLVSLVWFLIRVIPKPSRASYPCQQAAFPLACGFITWLTGLVGSVFAIRRAGRLWRQSRWPLALTCLAIAAALGAIAIQHTPETPLSAAQSQAPVVMGEGKGIHPGRVVWVHAPDATSWDGFSSPASSVRP